MSSTRRGFLAAVGTAPGCFLKKVLPLKEEPAVKESSRDALEDWLLEYGYDREKARLVAKHYCQEGLELMLEMMSEWETYEGIDELREVLGHWESGDSVDAWTKECVDGWGW